MIRPLKLDMPEMDGETLVTSFHPDGHDFSNAAEMTHWIVTGEKKVIHENGQQDNRNLFDRF